MRKVCRYDGMSEQEFLRRHPELRPIVKKVESERLAGTRPKPSKTLLDKSTLLTPEKRPMLLDAVAELVDENMTGRSDMCTQFAQLLTKSLCFLDLKAKVVVGQCVYFDQKGREIYKWSHAWVRISNEIVDGNVDSVFENPKVPSTVLVCPYWGPIDQTPKDRKFQPVKYATADADMDVNNIWWPDLQKWIEAKLL